MAGILYKRNKEGAIEECRVDARKVASMLASGDYKAQKSDFDDIKSFNDADTNNTGKLSADEVRAAAKKAGIENWENARIKTLKRELGYDI